MAKPGAVTPPLDGNAVRTQRTRSRILAESLRLFNEKGEGQVTTGMIAAALNMSPGNLYYHFRNKDQIVEHLFREFEERIGVEPGPDAPAGMEDLWLYLHLMLEGIWDYRFLYRNLDDLLERNRRLREHFNRIIDHKYAAVVALCEGLVRARSMRATPEEIRALARNVILVATYWLNFQAVRGTFQGRDAAVAGAGEDVGLGAYQVMTLVAPYLVGDARRHLDRLSRNYLE
jgi:AcrR family transcriptional regulator